MNIRRNRSFRAVRSVHGRQVSVPFREHLPRLWGRALRPGVDPVLGGLTVLAPAIYCPSWVPMIRVVLLWILLVLLLVGARQMSPVEWIGVIEQLVG